MSVGVVSFTTIITHPFQLICLPHAFCWSQRNPFIRQLFGHSIQHICPDISRTDTIDSTKIYPFDRKTLCQMYQPSLGSVVLVSSYNSSALRAKKNPMFQACSETEASVVERSRSRSGGNSQKEEEKKLTMACLSGIFTIIPDMLVVKMIFPPLP